MRSNPPHSRSASPQIGFSPRRAYGLPLSAVGSQHFNETALDLLENMWADGKSKLARVVWNLPELSATATPPLMLRVICDQECNFHISMDLLLLSCYLDEDQMKRRNLEQELIKLGWWFLRHGGKHDVWTNGFDQEAIPRHPEINEYTAKAIIKRAKEQPCK